MTITIGTERTSGGEMTERMSASYIIKQAAIRWYGPAFTLGTIGLGDFILEELKAHGYAVVELPEPDEQLMSYLGIGGGALTAALEQGLKIGKGSPGGLTEIFNTSNVDEEPD